MRPGALLRVLLVATAGLGIWAGWALLPGSSVQAAQTADSCTNCHQNLAGKLAAPAEGMSEDVHGRAELRCAGCHGGDPARSGMDAHDPAAGFRGVPQRRQVPQQCARCHEDPTFMRRFNPSLPTDQFARYLTSEHGKHLAAGDGNVAVCTSCHGVHPVRAVSDARSPVFPTNVPSTCARCHADVALMKPYGIPTSQFAEYRESVHGQALLRRGNRQSPACNDCHGNHGAAPPGVESVANVCAQCHRATRDLFVRSPHKRAFDTLGMAECTVCHGTHNISFPTDVMLGQEQGSVCLRCHPGGTAGLRAAAEMRATLEEVKAAIAQAEAILKRAAGAGMDVGDARIDLDEATSQLIRARAVTHTTSPPEVRRVTAVGLTAAGRARAVGEAALAEMGFRRRGLGVSVAIIAFVAILLWLKLRELKHTPASR